MVKIALCDDEEIFLDKMAGYCERYFTDKEIEYEVTEYPDGSELLAAEEEYDIVFLDVEMPGMNGIEIKKYMEGRQSGARIVFISGYPEAMPDAFGDNVSGFLVKPVPYEKLCRKLDELLVKINRDRCFIMCSSGGEQVKIFVKDIMYIEAEGRYTKVHMACNGVIKLVSKSISDYEKENCEDLVRCHKSYIVNLSYVRKVKTEVKLKNGVELPLGRTARDSVRDEFERYILYRS